MSHWDANWNLGAANTHFIHIIGGTSGGSGFGIGDYVRVTENLNVRTGPGTSYPEITDPDYPGYAPAGTIGKVLSGPSSANGYIWWKIDYDTGSYSGWSVEGGLEKRDDVTLTLYVHDGSSSGPVLSGVSVTGQDGDGTSFSKTTSSSGYVTITGTPGTWQFTASKSSYQTNTWSQSITTTCTKHAFLEKDDVTLTLYVHDGSSSGPVLSGVSVTGQDGDGTSFSKTTSSSGYVTITGTPGTWQFTASKSSYQTNTWSQSITTTCTKNAFLEKDDVTLTLYVRDGSSSGPVLSGVSVTGQDGDGTSFSKTTSSSGYVTITGTPGTWQFKISKSGYKSVEWSMSITTTCVKDAYFSETEDTTPPTLTITSPADGTTVTTPSITITGTASDSSGIASVTVNGALASGALDWSTWSAEVTLAEGENTITVVATDNAGLTTTRTKNVFLEEVSGEMVKGIDVSHHQGDIVWSEVYNSGCRFAFVKASEGDADPPQIIDDHFEINMEEGYDAGVLMGAYHFAHPQYNDAVDEAQFFVSVAGEYFKGGYIRPVLDLEEGDELGKEALSNWIHEFMSTVEIETGVEPILYISSNYASNSNLDDSVTKYDLWIAHWTYNPDAYPDTGIWDSWNFWQYSNESSVSGIGGYVDGGLFNGDISTLNTFVIAGPPTSCAIELREQGTTSTIDEIDVGHSFDICVDDSTGDIKEVRFSSDESQDGNPTGTWTSWYDWDTSSGDWNAETKIKTWSFATGLEKEVLAEIKDGSGDVSQCNASIFAHPGYAIIVAGNAMQGWRHVLEPRMINRCVDTSYSALRNLGFDDAHIFYLTNLSDEEYTVDAPASLRGHRKITYRNQLVSCTPASLDNIE